MNFVQFLNAQNKLSNKKYCIWVFSVVHYQKKESISKQILNTHHVTVVENLMKGKTP